MRELFSIEKLGIGFSSDSKQAIFQAKQRTAFARESCNFVYACVS